MPVCHIMRRLATSAALQATACLESDGYYVAKSLVPAQIAAAAASAVRDRVASVLKLYGAKKPGKQLEEMLAVPDWQRSPEQWTGVKFGSVGKRGWMKGPGTGRLLGAMC